MRNQLRLFIRRHPRRVVAGVVAVGAAMLLLSSVSLGAGSGGPPRFEGIFERAGPGGYNEFLSSTRVKLEAAMVAERLDTKTESYYSTEPDGPWTLVNSNTYSENAHNNSIQPVPLGVPDNPEGERISIGEPEAFLRGLTPDKSYYARFVAKNADGGAEEVIPFKTLPVEKPEVEKVVGREVIAFAGTGLLVSNPDTEVEFEAKVEDNGALTTYHFEYAESEVGPWKEFTSGASGAISAVEEYKWVHASVVSLKPETTYFVRLKLSNEKGETVQNKYLAGPGTTESKSFTTLTAKPSTNGAALRNVTADSAFVFTHVFPRGSETKWRLEYTSEPTNAASWAVVPGGLGTVSQVQAEAVGYDGSAPGAVGVRLTGLNASTTYYVRAAATNTCAEGCGSLTSEVSSFTTASGPSATASSVHGLDGESLRLLGSVDPDSEPTSDEQLITLEGSPTGGTFMLSFDGHSSESIPYDASPGAVESALGRVAPSVSVEGPDGGPYTIYFTNVSAGVSEPQIEGDGSGLSPSGSAVKVVTTQAGGVAYDAHYRFEYVSQASFAEDGWADAVQGPEGDAGSGVSAQYVGYDPPGLVAGETYRYRVVAESNAPSTGPVDSSEQTLTVPVLPERTTEDCGNESFRTGASAHLPDCRAYEQLTPVEKEGAQEPFHYGGVNIGNSVLVGEEGEHVLFEAEGTDYQAGPSAGQSPYLFSREPGDWGMVAGLAQPEAGVRRYTPQVYSSDVTRVALASEYQTSGSEKSAEVEYKLGPVGGPYALVKSVPRQYPDEAGNLGEVSGWVAGDPSLSKLVLMSSDHELLGGETGTKSGSDLYEYTVSGGLTQLNVSGEPVVTIGSCGATIVKGFEDGEGERVGRSSQHSISEDGSRVFFEAVPGKKCREEASDLYMRVNGSETIDIGAYRFLAADTVGSRVLLETDTGTPETVLYDTESGSGRTLPELAGVRLSTANLVVSAGFDSMYYFDGTGLYRYDVSGQKLEYLVPISLDSAALNRLELTVSSDGRYVYFNGGVGGMAAEGIYRYDNDEHVVECVSCASSFDPEPKLPSFMTGADSDPKINGAMPLDTSVSGNGDYAFFTTPAALVPEDNDGEIPIDKTESGEYADTGGAASPSSDIYEWRAGGVHGCAQLDGCLALITAGHGGFKSLLLGTADEGRDVLIYTREKLLGQDTDTSGDIYDVREGGGFAPPPPRPTECEADACSTPPSAPNDVTPSSFTFTGVGNVLVEATVSNPVVKSGKLKSKASIGKKKTGKKGRKGKTHKGRKSSAKRSIRRDGRAGR
jgi:hypothetical protein